MPETGIPGQLEAMIAGVCDGLHGAVWLFLLKHGAKSINDGVAVHVELATAVSDGLPVGEENDGRGGKLSEYPAHNDLHDDVN